jgi:phage tail-like protein
MRGPISDTGPGPVGTAYRVSGPVPALFHEDPLFLDLCAAFDELLQPIVAVLDCFPAYLDPWLAPEDFLGWLGALAGADAEGPGEPPRRRAHIAGAVRGHGLRGTAAGLRHAAASAAGVPVERVAVADCGGVVWATTNGGAAPPPFDPLVTVTVTVPGGTAATAAAATAAATAAVRDAVQPILPVSYRLRIEVVEK